MKRDENLDITLPETNQTKPNQKKNFLYVVNEDKLSGSAVVVREKGWNHWDGEADEKLQIPRHLRVRVLTRPTLINGAVTTSLRRMT